MQRHIREYQFNPKDHRNKPKCANLCNIQEIAIVVLILIFIIVRSEKERVQFYDGFYEEEKALSGPFVNEISKNSYHLVDWPFIEKKIPTKHKCLESFKLEQLVIVFSHVVSNISYSMSSAFWCKRTKSAQK